MKRLALSLGVLALVAAGGWWLDRSRAEMSARIETNRARPPEVAASSSEMDRGQSIVRAVRRRAVRDVADEAERRDWRECFPNASTPIATWSEAHPDEITVAPCTDLPLTFRQTRIERDGAITTWFGRSADLPGGSFVGVARLGGGYDAILLIPGASQFFFHVRDGVVRVEESVASGEDCGVGNWPRRAVAAKDSHVHYAEAGDAGWQTGASETSAATDAPLNADVLFLYNAHALTVAQQRSTDPLGYIDGYSRASLATCNQALENSRVDTFRWRFIGLAAAPSYPNQTTVGEEVRVLAPEGPLGDFVSRIRQAYGADQVLMWIGTGERKGAAYAGDVPQTPATREYAVAALRLTAPVLILAHELAHNFGCHHDRGHAGSGGGDVAQPDGDGYWRYGLLWEDPASEGDTISGTVMAYADWLVPYFSNPHITLEVTSTMQGRGGAARSLGTKTIGYPENDPRAAYNVRILNDSSAAIAALGTEDESVPQIWDQPRAQAVSVGGELQLRVAASGRNLSYQWRRDGTAIPGATDAAFAKTFAPGDAGSYSVIVANPKGSITSDAATVSAAVASPTPSNPNPPAAGGGGAGGGGGAPSVGFLVAIALFAVWKRARRPT